MPFGPFHPTLDEPAHFRLYVDGEMVRGCEYRGFMAHRGIEKLAESVLSYNDIPIMAERICGICGCVHNVAYAQAVESAGACKPPPRAEYLRTIMLELERLHSHLLWVGLACHIVGFDTLFMQCFRIREPIMWIAEKITGNRKTYGLCVIGGVRRDMTPELKTELPAGAQPAGNGVASRSSARSSRTTTSRSARAASACADRNLVKKAGAASGRWRARRAWTSIAGATIPTPPTTAWNSTSSPRATAMCGRAWWCGRRKCSSQSESSANAWTKWRAGRSQLEIKDELPVGRLGLSSVEAPRGECHHFVITGENNRPRRWRVRAPTYQNLQAYSGDDQGPATRRHDHLAGQHRSLLLLHRPAGNDLDLRRATVKVWSQEELLKLTRAKKA